MYQYNENCAISIGGFSRKVPKKSKRYSLNRKALEKKRYPGNNTVSQFGCPGNVSKEQTDLASVAQSMSCVPLPPSISQEHFLGIIGELNKAFMKSNINDASPSEAKSQTIPSFSNGNDIQNSKCIGTSGTRAPFAQAPSVCTSGLPCVSQNSCFNQTGDAYRLQQLDRTMNQITSISSQSVCVDRPRIINNNTNYIPHGCIDTVILSNSINGGISPCVPSPVFPRTTIRPAPPAPQGMCTAVPNNYPCVAQSRLPYVQGDPVVFVERMPQASHIWNGARMPPPPPPPPPSMMGFWDTQGTPCSASFVQNIPIQDVNHLPNFPTLNYPVPYHAEVDTLPGYPNVW